LNPAGTEEEDVNRGTLKLFVVALGLGIFVILYAIAAWQILTAPNGTVPTLGDTYSAAVTLLAGGLGSAFAIAIGVKGSTLGEAWRWPKIDLKDVYMVGLYLYAVAAAVGLLVSLLNPAESPSWFTSLALVFVGYVAALIGKGADVA
jgi:hypothetical protein